MDAFIGEGLGRALSNQAERMDLERRSKQAFEREKELTAYRLQQEELAARSAYAADGSRTLQEKQRQGGYEHDRGTDWTYQEKEMDKSQEQQRENDYYKYLYEKGIIGYQEYLQHLNRRGGPGAPNPGDIAPPPGVNRPEMVNTPAPAKAKTKSKGRGKPSKPATPEQEDAARRERFKSGNPTQQDIEWGAREEARLDKTENQQLMDFANSSKPSSNPEVYRPKKLENPYGR